MSAFRVLTSCTKSEDTGNQSAPGAGGAQVAEAGADGPTCGLEQYGGAKLGLKDAVISFSQSEKEANPFRIAETRSIRDEAEALGARQPLTTNANSQLSKQISDIQDLINQGAQEMAKALDNVTTDSTKGFVDELALGALFAVVESNPRFGPLAFETLGAFLSGEPVAQTVVISDKLYDKDNAPAEVANAY